MSILKLKIFKHIHHNCSQKQQMKMLHAGFISVYFDEFIKVHSLNSSQILTDMASN